MKKVHVFYGITVFLLIAMVSVPFSEFMKMCMNRYGRSEYVVPFLGVTGAILIVFLLMPLFIKKGGFRNCWIAVGLFFIIELFVEYMTAKINGVHQLMITRMYIPDDMLLEIASIPPIVRIHYYIFSIILIMIVLGFLYQLYLIFSDGEKQKHLIPSTMVLGSSAMLYALAYLFVKVIHYNDYAQLRITWNSVLSAAICFMLAGNALGILVGSQMKFDGKKKYVPSIIAFLSSLTLYFAEFIMLKGKLYIYGDSGLLLNLPFIHISIAHLIVLFFPAFMVYFILKKISKYN